MGHVFDNALKTSQKVWFKTLLSWECFCYVLVYLVYVIKQLAIRQNIAWLRQTCYHKSNHFANLLSWVVIDWALCALSQFLEDLPGWVAIDRAYPALSRFPGLRCNRSKTKKSRLRGHAAGFDIYHAWADSHPFVLATWRHHRWLSAEDLSSSDSHRCCLCATHYSNLRSCCWWLSRKGLPPEN